MTLQISKYIDLIIPSFEITGTWNIPVLTYNPYVINPYHRSLPFLNADKRYRKKVVNYYYTSLTEKWLHSKKCFQKLFKYFTVTTSGDHRNVTLVSKMDDVGRSKFTEIDKKYILKYIEEHLVSKKLVKQILKDYTAIAKTNWYDLLYNKHTVIRLFCHVLNKIISFMIQYSRK
jgi:hypothetical protein